jgi:hypothetical protein
MLKSGRMANLDKKVGWFGDFLTQTRKLRIMDRENVQLVVYFEWDKADKNSAVKKWGVPLFGGKGVVIRSDG